MQEYKVILTKSAINDLVDITIYIESLFGERRADLFQNQMRREIEKLSYMWSMHPSTQIYYRGYGIHRRVFSPSIIFYICVDSKKEIHILRILREERNWEHLLGNLSDHNQE